MGRKLEFFSGRRGEPRREKIAPGVDTSRCQLLGRNFRFVTGPRSKDTKKCRAVNISWPSSFTSRSLFWLDFPPGRRAPARPVVRRKVLGHHAFVALVQRRRVQRRARPDDTGGED